MTLYDADTAADLHNQTLAYLKVAEQAHVLTVTLNRPEKKNAMNNTMMREIGYVLSYAHHQPDIWAVVIEAAGTVFCAGADLKTFAGHEDEPNSSTVPPIQDEVLLGDLFQGLYKPCVARVEGPVYAGGFLIICGCTHVLTTPDVTFSLTEARRGIWPMQVMASLLPLVPKRVVADLCIRAQVIFAAQAQEIGLVNQVVEPEDMEKTLDALLDDIRLSSPSAIHTGLKAMAELATLDPAKTHAFLKQELNQLLQTEDAREGIQAFLEKRPPQWKGV